MNKNKVKVIIIGVIFLMLLFGCIHERIQYHHYTAFETHQMKCKLEYDSIKLMLSNEIDNYISRVAPMSSLDGIVIVEKCLEYDIDVCFVLAQGEQESHFGTQGLARKTNSVFNVFAFDGHDYNQINKNGKYAHPNDCVGPYLHLLKTTYLVNGKTEYDMLNKFVNKNGSRYASAANYEQLLYDKVNKIKTTTEISNIYQRLLKHKMLIEM